MTLSGNSAKRRLSQTFGRSRSGKVFVNAPYVVRFRIGHQVPLEIAYDQGYRSLIGVNRAAGELFFDRTRSRPHFHDAFADRHAAPIEVRDGRAKLRVFVDQSIVEIFANDGRTTLTDRFFRGSKTLQWSATARNGTARIRSLDVWQMADARPRGDGTNQAPASTLQRQL